MLIDTHCHLDILATQQFVKPLTESDIAIIAHIIKQAEAQGVHEIITVGTTIIDSENCIKLAHTFPNVYAAIGIHPTDCPPDFSSAISTLKKMVSSDERVVAIGETGLDFHHPGFNVPRQKDAFKAQIELALASDRALIVHTRKAFDETLTILEEYKHDLKRCVIHSFSEDLACAKTIIDYGWIIGINATITYPKNTMLRSIVTQLPLHSFVLETDAPFLPPQSMRGKKNHPQYIATIAEYIAGLRGIPLDEVAHVTHATSCTLFSIPF